MIAEWQVAIALALIAQTGLVLVAWQQRRRTQLDKAASAVSILHDVNDELRIELTRMFNDRTDYISRLNLEINELKDQLRLAREESRGAHETAGRCIRRVDYLEGVLRSHGVQFEPGPYE